MDKATNGPRTMPRSEWTRHGFILALNLPFWALVLWGTFALDDTQAWRAGGMSLSFAVTAGFLHITLGLTALAVRASAPFLDDAEDAEDARREGRALLLGAGALIAAGSSMILLALSGPERFVSPVPALGAALLLNAIAMALVIVRRRGIDELNRAIERDSGYLAFKWFSLVAGMWAILAHLGFVTAPSPLDWLSMIWIFSFAGGIIAAARKGSFDPPASASQASD